MTPPVDLDALDRLRAAATPGTWHRYQTGIGEFVCATAPGKGNAVYADTPGGTFPSADLHLIVALVNAYPAMAAELRELRAKVAELTAMNMGLEQMLDEAEPIVQTRGPKP